MGETADPGKIEDWECSRCRCAGTITFSPDMVPSGTRHKIDCSVHGETNGIPAARFRNP